MTTLRTTSWENVDYTGATAEPPRNSGPVSHGPTEKRESAVARAGDKFNMIASRNTSKGLLSRRPLPLVWLRRAGYDFGLKATSPRTACRTRAPYLNKNAAADKTCRKSSRNHRGPNNVFACFSCDLAGVTSPKPARLRPGRNKR